jgi:hypothetical protein
MASVIRHWLLIRSRIPNVEKLGSQLRRLSADAAQHGGSDAWNKIFGSFMYANLSVQSLYEIGKMMKNDPVEHSLILVL